MAVVCAGPKAILDVPATLEYLETRGVPVVAVGQEDLPGFYARSSGIRAPAVGGDIAGGRRARRRVHLGLGLGGGVLSACPSRPTRHSRTTAARDVVGAGRPATPRRRASVGRPLTPLAPGAGSRWSPRRIVRANTALIVNDAAGRRRARRASPRLCRASARAPPCSIDILPGIRRASSQRRPGVYLPILPERSRGPPCPSRPARPPSTRRGVRRVYNIKPTP